MQITVKGRYTTLVKDDTLVQNSEKLYIGEFIFDESWDGFSRTAVFGAETAHVEVSLAENRCIVPSKCLERAGVKLRIGVYGERNGERRDTSWCLTGNILYEVKFGKLVPTPGPNLPDIPADAYAQIIEVIRASTATDAEVEEVLDKTFGGKTEQAESPDNTATDKEVADILNDIFGETP